MRYRDESVKEYYSDMPMPKSKQLFFLDCLAMVQHGILLLMLGPLVPGMMESFAIGESAIGVLLSVGSLGFMLAPASAGLIIDRRGVKSIFLAGAAIEFAFLMTLGFSRLFLLSVLATFFVHVGAGFVETGANVVPTLIRGRRSAHSTMNFIHLFFSLGALLAPLLIGAFLEVSENWRDIPLLVLVPTAILLLASGLVRMPGSVPTTNTENSGNRGSPPLMRRLTLLGGGALFFYVGAEVGVSAWIILYLIETLGFTGLQAASALSLLWASILAGRFVNGALGNRLKARTLVLLSGLGGAVGVLVLVATNSGVVAYVSVCWIGLGFAGTYPNVMAEVNRRIPRRAGAVTGMLATFGAAGAASFQWIIGAIAERSSLRIALLVPALLQVLAVISFMMAIAGERRQVDVVPSLTDPHSS